jgi:hypothetical protein
MFVKWGKAGLFLFMIIKGAAHWLGNPRKRFFLAGWQDPVAPNIVKALYGRDFRILKKRAKHPLDSVQISKESKKELNEDLYPLI